MGALFALFNTNELKNFELNWKDIEKSHPADASLYAECKKMLQTCAEILQSIDNYEGGREEIKIAMSASQGSEEQKEAIRNAMIRVIPNAALSQSWMQFAQKLSKFLVKRLLPRLSKPIIDGYNDDGSSDEEEVEVPQDDIQYDNDEENGNNDDDEKKVNNDQVSELTILTHQALCHEFALILDFLLTFDQKKMMQPEIQNDFSFYKRTLSKQNEEYLKDLEWSVSNEKAGFISMFLAQAIPLIKEVSNTLSNNKQSLKILAIFCNSAYSLLKENKFKKDTKSQLLALRAMTASFIIYDHGNQEFGAFQRKSDTKAQKIVSMICNDYISLYGDEDNDNNDIKQEINGLKNIIKFASIHFDDNNTSQSIKNMINQ